MTPAVPLQLWPLIAAAYRQFFAHFWRFLMFAIVPVALTLVLTLPTFPPAQLLYIYLIRSPWLPEFGHEILFLFRLGGVTFLVNACLWLLMLTLFAVAWLRLLLSNETRGWWRWSRLHGRFLLRLPLAFLGFIVVFLIGIGIRQAVESWSSFDGLMALWSVMAALPWWLFDLALLATVPLILARIGPLYPAMVSGTPMSVRAAWQDTAGQGLRLSGALILGAVLPYAVLLFVERVVFLLIDDHPEVPFDRLPPSEQMIWHLFTLPTTFALFAAIAIGLTMLTQIYRGNYGNGAGSHGALLERLE